VIEPPAATWPALPELRIVSRPRGAFTYTGTLPDEVAASVDEMLAVFTTGMAADDEKGLSIVVLTTTLEVPEPAASEPMFHVTVRVPPL